MNSFAQRARSIVQGVVGRHPPEAWVSLCDQACGDDNELRREVARLLMEQGKPDADVPSAVPTVEHVGNEDAATYIGPCRLRERLGSGGMGIVWAAEQKQPLRRKVAIKVIRPGMDSEQVLARFEAEREALALMNHPYIARILSEHWRRVDLDSWNEWIRENLLPYYIDGDEEHLLRKAHGSEYPRRWLTLSHSSIAAHYFGRGDVTAAKKHATSCVGQHVIYLTDHKWWRALLARSEKWPSDRGQ